MSEAIPPRDEHQTILQATQLADAGRAPHELPANPGPLSRLDDYELVREIGRGGMGVVFQARDVKLNRVVALKMIRDGALANADELQRFDKEAAAAAQFQHPNIVALFHIGKHAQRPYFCMEYISGTSLAERVALGPIASRRAAVYLEAIARAVHYAHQRGILHRDLKPGNILLDENDQPKVTDFGLAKSMTTGSDQTRTGAVLGTPSYMSPEQAAGLRTLGPAADVYSLGAILYELLTGKPPFIGDTALATLKMVAEQEPISPQLINPLADPDLVTICLKCLEKDPRRRYASAEAMADDLARHLRGEPIVARRVSVVGRAVKWVRRKPATAAILTLSILGLAGFVWFLWHTALEEKSLREAAVKANKLADVRWEAARHLLYLSEMRRAQNALERANFDSVDRLLRDWTPDAKFSDLRDWEWRFLKQQSQSRFSVGMHTGHASAVAYAPDGKHLASAGGEFTKPGEIKIWDLRGGKLLHTLRGHANVITTLAYFPDKNWLASAGYDSVVKLWDLDKGAEIATLRGHAQHINHLAISCTGEWIATASADKTARLWRVAEHLAGDAAPAVLRGHTGEVAAVAFHPQGNKLATGSHDRTVKLWNLDTLAEEKTLLGHEGEVDCLAYSSAGKILVSGGGRGFQRGEVKFWDADTAKVRYAHYGLSDRITSLAVSRDGKVAASGSDGVIRIWNQNLTSEARVFRGDTQLVYGLAFSPDGHMLASAGRSGRVSVWNSSGGLETFTLSAQGQMDTVAFNPHPKMPYLASAGRITGAVAVWNLDAPNQPTYLKGHEGAVTCLAFSPDGVKVASGGSDKTVRIDDFRKPEWIPVILQGHTGAVRALAFRPDGKVIATASEDETIRLHDPVTGKLVKELKGHANGVLSLAFSNDGQWLASGSYDKTIRVWSSASDKEHFVLAGHTGSVNTLAFSPDGQWLASGSADKTIRVWEIAKREEYRRLEGSPSPILSLAYHPQGRRLVSVAQDKTLRLWDIVTRQEILELEEMAGPIRAVAFSRDGRYLAGAGHNVVRVWDGGDK